MIVNPVDGEGEDVIGGKPNEDECGVLPLDFVVRLGTKNMAKRQTRHAFAAEGHQSTVSCIGKIDMVARSKDDFLDVTAWDGIALTTAADGQSGNNAEGEGQPKKEARPFVRLARHGDRAADALDIRSHDIHAHAAARHGTDLFGCGEARFEDQIMSTALGHFVDFGLGVDSCRDGLGRKAVCIDTATVIGDDDRYLITCLARGKFQQTDFPLAGFQAFARTFQSVIDCVADNVRQWIAHHFHHLAVEFDLATFEIHHDLLAEFGRQIPHQSREGGEEVLQSLHAHASDRCSNIGQDGAEAIERSIDSRLFARFAQPAGEVVSCQDHVGNALHHLVEQFGRKADRTLDGCARSLGCGRIVADLGGQVIRFCRGKFTDDVYSFPGLQCIDQRIVAAFGKLFAGPDCIGHLADAIDDGEDCRNERTVRFAALGTAFGQGILGSVAEPLQTRKIEEAAIALHGVNETKNCIEPRPIRGIGFPCDDLAAARFQHLASFCYEIRQQVIHHVTPLVRSGEAMDDDG